MYHQFIQSESVLRRVFGYVDKTLTRVCLFVPRQMWVMNKHICELKCNNDGSEPRAFY